MTVKKTIKESDTKSSQIEEIYSLLCEVDIAVAGHNTDGVEDVMTDIVGRCYSLADQEVTEWALILQNMLLSDNHQTGSVHRYARIDHLLMSLRKALYNARDEI